MRNALKFIIPLVLIVITSIMMINLVLEFIAAIVFCVSCAFFLHAVIELINDKLD